MNPSDIGRRCPVDMALDVVGGKWKTLILWRLSKGTLRFNALQRAIPGVTQRMLTLQLRELERDGMVRREVHAEVPPGVEYSLTPPAVAVVPVLVALGQWLSAHHGELQQHAPVPLPEPAEEGEDDRYKVVPG